MVFILCCRLSLTRKHGALTYSTGNERTAHGIMILSSAAGFHVLLITPSKVELDDQRILAQCLLVVAINLPAAFRLSPF